MKLKAIKVSMLNQYIKNYLKGNSIFNNLRVEGEISNLRISKSGYTYFTLCDESACISCVCFYREGMATEGDRIIADGEISIYEARGTYQLMVRKIESTGAGKMRMNFEALRERLKAEGKFDKHREAPLYPGRIGVITSKSGAALRDILKTLESAGGSFEIIVYDVLVQGLSSASGIKEGVEYFNSVYNVDVILVARGGGSAEDLNVFNEISVIESIYGSLVPVVTGIGHETDRTLSDYVADVYCHTPTAAAEYIIRGYREIYAEIERLKNLLHMRMEMSLRYKRSEAVALRHIMKSSLPVARIYGLRAEADGLLGTVKRCLNVRVSSLNSELQRLKGVLKSNNPVNNLKGGHALVAGVNGMTVYSKKDLSAGDEVRIVWKDFEADARIISVDKKVRYTDE